MTPRRRLLRALRTLALLVAPLAGAPAATLRGHAAAAQETPVLHLQGPDGQDVAVPVANHRGYYAVPVSVLAQLGWLDTTADGLRRLVHGTGIRIELRPGSPFLRWDGVLLQLVHPPYLLGPDLFVPLQLVTDFFPARLPDAYAFRAAPAGTATLRVLAGTHWGAPDPGPPQPEAPDPAPPPSRTRVVVIDPGHGGVDPGALGPGGTREKDVALALGRALAEELRRYPDVEVHVTRDTDVLVPLWQRGEWATERKGDHPAVFLSLHANALPSNRGARGFETYFLADARTDHERRVAALENAPLDLEREQGIGGDSDLGFILQELRNLDHQHWSSLLAEQIQEEVAAIHPGPDRGVKQGPFAVITNALMPAVLVEIGFISNREEERLLARPSFHRDAARALARAVVAFFERYPPGQGTTLEPGDGGLPAGRASPAGGGAPEQP